MRASVLRSVGQVPSPTPMIGMLGDSTSVTLKPARHAAAVLGGDDAGRQPAGGAAADDDDFLTA